MKERDDQYTQQLKDWRVQISQRKKARNLCDYIVFIRLLLCRNWRKNLQCRGRIYRTILTMRLLQLNYHQGPHFIQEQHHIVM